MKTADPHATRPVFIHRLLEIDADLSGRLNIARSPGWKRRLLAFLAHSGDSWFMIPVMGLIWFFGDEIWKWRMLVMVLAMCVTAVLAVGFKFLIRRRRPEGEWGLIYRSTDPHSFPSGHAARLAMLAILSLLTGPAGLAIFLFIWAPLVALARVAMGVHYLSDVLGGAGLGLTMGFFFLLLLG